MFCAMYKFWNSINSIVDYTQIFAWIIHRLQIWNDLMKHPDSYTQHPTSGTICKSFHFYPRLAEWYVCIWVYVLLIRNNDETIITYILTKIQDKDGWWGMILLYTWLAQQFFKLQLNECQSQVQHGPQSKARKSSMTIQIGLHTQAVQSRLNAGTKKITCSLKLNSITYSIEYNMK